MHACIYYAGFSRLVQCTGSKCRVSKSALQNRGLYIWQFFVRYVVMENG